MPRLPREARQILAMHGLKVQDMYVLAALDRKWKTPGQIASEADMGARAVGASLARLVVVSPLVVSVQFAPWRSRKNDLMAGKYEYRIRVVGTRLLALFEQARTQAS